jgi:hypothetical protein
MGPHLLKLGLETSKHAVSHLSGVQNALFPSLQTADAVLNSLLQMEAGQLVDAGKQLLDIAEYAAFSQDKELETPRSL